MNFRHPFTPRQLGFEREKPLESLTFFLLLFFIASAPFPWGAVLPAGLLRIEVFAFLIGALTLASGSRLSSARHARWPISILTALAILGLVQLIPLPHGLLHLISPSSATVYGDTNDILTLFSHPTVVPRISIAPSATLGATLFVAALVSLGFSSSILLAARRRRRTFLAVLLGSAVVQALVATSTFGPRTTGRISGTFINPNHFAAYLEIAFACALGVLWREILLSRERGHPGRDRAERLERRLLPISMAALLVGALGVGIGLTKSRGGIAAALLMTLIVLTYGLLHRRLRSRSRIVILTLVMITLAFGFMAATAKREPILRYLESDPREIGADMRVTLWKTSIEAWRDYPILGSGLGTFREAYRPRQPREITPLVEQAHSDPLQLLVTGGALGFLLGVGAFLSCLTILSKRFHRQEHREESAFVLGALGALLVLGIHGLVEFNFSIPAIPATLVCVLGLAFAAGSWSQAPTKKPSESFTGD